MGDMADYALEAIEAYEVEVEYFKRRKRQKDWAIKNSPKTIEEIQLKFENQRLTDVR